MLDMITMERWGMLKIKNLDNLFYKVLNYLDNTNCKSIAFAQGGDYIGGINGAMRDGLKRKVMNTFFCRTDRPFKFYGKINEDVNCYVLNGSRGELYLSLMEISVEQLQTQSNLGGLTDIYLNLGTYIKSFYSVIMTVKINLMGNKNKRLHHKVKWNYCVPKIINEKFKKIKGVI